MSWIDEYNYWLTASEQATINETMENFDLTVVEKTEARYQILQEAKKGGRFYAYNVTNMVCARIANAAKPA